MPRGTRIQVKINPVILNQELGKGRNGMIVSNEIHKAIADDVERKQNELLVEAFFNHDVTKEILNGPKASNKSGTLGGYGNLYSFLGFSSGDDPIGQVAAILSAKMTYKVRSIKNGKYKISLMIPTAKEIFEQTPMPWANGMSWARSIEKGVSNAASYIFNPRGLPNSSSGTGLQSQNKVSGVNFQTTPYITSLIREFRKEIRKL